MFSAASLRSCLTSFAVQSLPLLRVYFGIDVITCLPCFRALDNVKAPLDGSLQNRLTAHATERKLLLSRAPVSTLTVLHGSNAEVPASALVFLVAESNSGISLVYLIPICSDENNSLLVIHKVGRSEIDRPTLIISRTPRSATTRVALHAGAVAHEGEVAAFAAHLAFIAAGFCFRAAFGL